MFHLEEADFEADWEEGLAMGIEEVGIKGMTASDVWEAVIFGFKTR